MITIEKDTKFINFFAGPGTGKSTSTAFTFAMLKSLGIDCEICSEFAKDKVWEKNHKIFQTQLYILGKQSWKMARLNGEVDYVITDCPIIMNAAYARRKDIVECAVQEFKKYGKNNINVFLKRVKPYNPNGRLQTEKEARELDKFIKKLLNKYKIKYIEVEATLKGIVDFIEKHLKLPAMSILPQRPMFNKPVKKEFSL